MKYFIDFEFLEGDVPVKIFGLNVPKWLIIPNNTIQPISVGIVSEDGREYYAISKDFNLEEAWNRYDLKLEKPEDSKQRKFKEYWIRNNVLFPIWKELSHKEYLESDNSKINIGEGMTYNSLKKLINKYGKTNKQIVEEIIRFTDPVQNMNKHIPDYMQVPEGFKIDYSKPEFYGYYADYDWVVFAWLFGKMINLPKRFPYYCIDLKQTLDEKAKSIPVAYDIEMGIKTLKLQNDFPKQTNEHNALVDAKWNYQLYKFLKNFNYV